MNVTDIIDGQPSIAIESKIRSAIETGIRISKVDTPDKEILINGHVEKIYRSILSDIQMALLASIPNLPNICYLCLKDGQGLVYDCTSDHK